MDGLHEENVTMILRGFEEKNADEKELTAVNINLIVMWERPSPLVELTCREIMRLYENR